MARGSVRIALVVGALTVRTFNLLRIDVGTLHVVPVAVEPS